MQTIALLKIMPKEITFVVISLNQLLRKYKSVIFATIIGVLHCGFTWCVSIYYILFSRD